MKKYRKRVLQIVLAIAMVLAISNTQNLVVYASETTVTMNVDANGVYQIGTPEQLTAFSHIINGTCSDYSSISVTKGTQTTTYTANGVSPAKYTDLQKRNANAILTANIDLNPGIAFNEDGTYTGGTPIQWTPIGGNDKEFDGTFDGNNKTISGIYSKDSTTAEDKGLFGDIGSGGTVKNIGIINSYILGNWMVGGVCGYNIGSITNSYNTGNISGNAFVGGVCGYNNRTGSITNSYNTGNISGNAYVGGVCSYNLKSITNCYNTGNISGNSYVGGVSGYNNKSITNCYYNTDNYSGKAIGSDNNSIDTTTFNKTSDQFASGEVAWLLDGSTAHSGKWGQKNLGVTGSTPTLISLDSDAKAVYKVTFDDLDYTTTNKVVYANAQGTVVLPTVNPTKTGYVFDKWMYNNEEFTASTAVTSDITVTTSYKNIPVSGITLNKSSLILAPGGDTDILTATILPTNADNKSVNWSSTDYNIAKVSSNGVVTSVAEGTATITVKTIDGDYTGTCAVNVLPSDCPVTYRGAEVRKHGDTYEIRFLATIDTLEADEVGFVFSKSEKIPTKINVPASNIKSNSTVYNSVTAMDSTVTAQSFGATYIIACTVTGITEADVDIPLYVRAFSIKNAEPKYTSVKTVTVNSLK